ncbi:hypothetical protein CFC21_052375 [Triticum aestivum]|uniref:Aminotransferase-like plant mobile domain-containing protein n=2 Tax=Triticum aestivum TaxID=4565 RepID=A0A9R1G9W8_WHEAT|nr:hypothetical protein CFC21_052375 [Triticum aestivum]
MQVSPMRLSGGSRYASRDGADASIEFVHYTVHIPPTPDRTTASASTDAPVAEEEGEVLPERSYVSGTIFTGGLNCATRAHCYMDCVAAFGNCPGCKEAYSAGSDTDDSVDEDDDDAISSLEERDQMPMTSMSKRFSMVHSIKMPMPSSNGKPADFDHARWLFETKGTYSYGNALWPENEHGGGGNSAWATSRFVGIEEPPNFGARCCRPLMRKTSVSQAILSPYRMLIAIRLVALGCGSRFSWLLDSLPKLCPVNRSYDLDVLADRFKLPTARNPKGCSDLPGIDVFISTADPEKEPPLVTANTILSILAADYPLRAHVGVVLPEARRRAALPESYFGQKRDFLKNKVRLDFIRESWKVKREYDEFKMQVNSLTEALRRRSDAYNAGEELRARRHLQEEVVATGGALGAAPLAETGAVKATWMSDGSQWADTWLTEATDHPRGNHAGIIQVIDRIHRCCCS